MVDTHYKIKHIRLHEEVWKTLKQKRRESGLSWNLYIKKLIYDEKLRKVSGK